jgi:hypothetical protein
MTEDGGGKGHDEVASNLRAKNQFDPIPIIIPHNINYSFTN